MNVYIIFSLHPRVRTMGPVVDLKTNYEVVAGTGVKCIPGARDHCGDGGLAVEARLSYPKGKVKPLFHLYSRG